MCPPRKSQNPKLKNQQIKVFRTAKPGTLGEYAELNTKEMTYQQREEKQKQLNKENDSYLFDVENEQRVYKLVAFYEIKLSELQLNTNKNWLTKVKIYFYYFIMKRLINKNRNFLMPVKPLSFFTQTHTKKKQEKQNSCIRNGQYENVVRQEETILEDGSIKKKIFKQDKLIKTIITKSKPQKEGNNE